MKVMDVTELYDLVKDGKFFSVRFIKRTDGSERLMNCRVGVVPRETGSHIRNWDPADKGLLSVWDSHKKAYRLVPADSILELHVRGRRIITNLAKE